MYILYQVGTAGGEGKSLGDLITTKSRKGKLIKIYYD